MVAGYFGGRVDAVVGYLLAVRLSMPVILVALAMASLVGGSVKVVILLLGLLLWDRFLIVSRSVTRQLREEGFVAAAKTLGASSAFIMVREILPNLLGPLKVVATLEIAHAILLEATLSFLGLGVQPPMPSWGLMVAEGKAYMFFQPWVILIPGVVPSLIGVQQGCAFRNRCPSAQACCSENPPYVAVTPQQHVRCVQAQAWEDVA